MPDLTLTAVCNLLATMSDEFKVALTNAAPGDDFNGLLMESARRAVDTAPSWVIPSAIEACEISASRCKKSGDLTGAADCWQHARVLRHASTPGIAALLQALDLHMRQAMTDARDDSTINDAILESTRRLMDSWPDRELVTEAIFCLETLAIELDLRGDSEAATFTNRQARALRAAILH